jgi:4-amino-4-deoxy-L-arabinose transferase-like glycosyltransferase
MTEPPRFTSGSLILFLIVLAAAAGMRIWYLTVCADNGQNEGPVQVQGSAQPERGATAQNPAAQPELRVLVNKLTSQQSFSSQAPLAAEEEATAHRAPGYPYLLAWLEHVPASLGTAESTIRWIQCSLGALTAAFYFLFALRAFGSRIVATLAGLLCAVHPFWIINTAEIQDGVLTTFLVATCLLLGAYGSQAGGPFTSLLYGLGLAGLALVRAALLPFAVVGVLWFLWRCRTVRRGWLCGLLAFLGFVNGLVPWSLRNYKEFGDIIPVADSAYLHLWMGNNEQANGGPQSEETILKALASERRENPKTTQEEMGRLKQPERYAQLGKEVFIQVCDNPAGTLQHRLQSSVAFLLGEAWLTHGMLWQSTATEGNPMPDWLARSFPALLFGSMLVMLLLGGLGWRWTYGWRHTAMPASLAVIWIALPYVLSHAETFSGPRLPLDGIFLCYAAFALTCLVTPAGSALFRGADSRATAEERPR